MGAMDILRAVNNHFELEGSSDDGDRSLSPAIECGPNPIDSTAE